MNNGWKEGACILLGVRLDSNSVMRYICPNFDLLDPYKLFEEFVTIPKEETGALPDKDEVLGRFYTLDLEKEGAIFVLERLQKRQQQQQEESYGEDKEKEGGDEETKAVAQREDYEDMIQVLKESLEREVVVAVTLDESSGLDSSDDEDDSDSDSDSVVEE